MDSRDRRSAGARHDRRVPIERFRRAEAKALRSTAGIPPFAVSRELVRKVQADCAIEVNGNVYSVPRRLMPEAPPRQPDRRHARSRRAALHYASIYDPARFLAEGMVSTWTQRSSCHSSNPSALVFALMRRAIAMASASFSQTTPWI
jgi:hypothetical protein